jgi:hypothetical protein
MNYRNKGVLAFVLLLTTVPALYSQTNTQEEPKSTPQRYVWLNGGIGVGTGLAGGLSLSYQHGHWLFSIRHAVTSKNEGVYIYQLRFRDIYDIGVLVGISSKKPGSMGYASIAAGIARVNGDPFDEFEATYGIPMEAQLFFTPLSFLAVGITMFTNLNSQKVFAGALLCLQIGKLR